VIAYPLFEPAVNEILTVVTAGVALRLVGASGVARVATDVALDSTESPMSFTAFNLMWYVVPAVRPEMVIGVRASAGSSAVNAP